MATLPDKELAKKLKLVHIQSALAERAKNTASLDLLEIWHQQIIEARICKSEHNIPDAVNEMELAIADIETITTKSEERIEIFRNIKPAAQPTIKKEEKQDTDNQLSLF